MEAIVDVTGDPGAVLEAAGQWRDVGGTHLTIRTTDPRPIRTSRLVRSTSTSTSSNGRSTRCATLRT